MYVCVSYREIPTSLSYVWSIFCVCVCVNSNLPSFLPLREARQWMIPTNTALLVRLERGSSVRDQSLSIYLSIPLSFAVKSRAVLPPGQQTASGVTENSRPVLCSSSVSSSFQHLPFPLLHLNVYNILLRSLPLNNPLIHS
jgi:hypothetical protein